ncbi:MAG: hypothetical protein HFE35_07525 [Clostridia bacterium]|jgi:hypothetical protein|uniref:hypothetical protein n=1 Tax=Pumilibacter muris TaxID=2941510 RepID=UPI0020403842|nr:hypothetical protein [Pumilibacter muris]MCI8596641.1 hypothetical protein [Clostridia bacterium]
MEDKKEETKAQEEKENNKPKSNFKNITFEMVLPNLKKGPSSLRALYYEQFGDRTPMFIEVPNIVVKLDFVHALYLGDVCYTGLNYLYDPNFNYVIPELKRSDGTVETEYPMAADNFNMLLKELAFPLKG